MGSDDIKRARQDIEERVAQAYWNDNVIDLPETTAIIAHVASGGVTQDEIDGAADLLAAAVAIRAQLEADYRTARDHVRRLQGSAGAPPDFEKYENALMCVIEIDSALRALYAKMGAYSLITRKLEEHPSRESQPQDRRP